MEHNGQVGGRGRDRLLEHLDHLPHGRRVVDPRAAQRMLRKEFLVILFDFFVTFVHGGVPRVHHDTRRVRLLQKAGIGVVQMVEHLLMVLQWLIFGVAIVCNVDDDERPGAAVHVQSRLQ